MDEVVQKLTRPESNCDSSENLSCKEMSFEITSAAQRILQSGKLKIIIRETIRARYNLKIAFRHF